MIPAYQLIRQRTRSGKVPVMCVIPPSGFLLDERVFMSLGLLRVAAVLAREQHPVEMLDLSGIENYEDVAAIQAERSQAMVACLTATTPQLPAAVRIAAAIRKAAPTMRIVIGGPHATLVHSAVKLERKAGRIGRAHVALEKLKSIFDTVVSGDGERAVFEAIEPDAPNLIDADLPKGGLFMSDADYEGMPMPARHLVDVDSYKYSIEGHKATSLIAQLGCPFHCGFCGGRNSNMLRRIRTRSTASIVRELEHLHTAYGYTGFMFYDDELNVNKGLVGLMREVTALQKRLGVEFRLRGFVKSELFTAEQASAMYEAGFRWLLCGFEAANPRILENIRKRAKLEDNDAVVRVAHEHGLKVKALMSVGHPGESEQSIRDVRDWLIDRKPDDFDCTIISTYPGTPYYDEAEPGERPGTWTYTAHTGDRLHAIEVDYTETADYYKGDPDGGYRAYVFTDHLEPEQVVELRDAVERDVRAELGIPFNPGAPGVRYEHSMGQSGPLPPFILREACPTKPESSGA